MVVKLYSYNQGSKGSEALASAMGIKRVRRENSVVKGGPDLKLINWGSTNIPEHLTENGTFVLNPPAMVSLMADKRVAFDFLYSACTMPPYVTTPGGARSWLADGHTVLARTTLNGHSGAGIVVMDPDDPETHSVMANLYTMYIKKKEEFRVHLVKNVDNTPNIIHIQRKGLKTGVSPEEANYMIRNLKNGFIYVKNDIVVPGKVQTEACAAFFASGLDFGAVDVIWNAHREAAYVLEINTAPGIIGATVEAYATALTKLIDDLKERGI